MTRRIALSVLIATLLTGVSTSAQSPGGQAPLVSRFVDPANGLSLEQAIARAIEQEPSLKVVRSQVEVAQGMRSQASLRANPSVSFEWRDEPGGTDHLATIGVEWPLDLFRKGERVAVADREVTVAQLSASDRERLLTAEVRARYGDVLATIRDLALFDEIVAATQNQFDLLRSRVEQGEISNCRQDVAIPRAHICRQNAFAIRNSEPGGRDLAVSDGDAPISPEQVERPRDPNRRQVVSAARFLAPLKRDGRIGFERRLDLSTLRHLHLTARRPE